MTAVVIVEDYPPVARGLARMVKSLLDGVQVAVFNDMASAREHLEEETVDLLLLDLNLEGRDGFDLLRESAAGAFHTIVVSGNTDRALEAFELGVLDFIGKPVTRERLQKALDRASGAAPPERPATRYFSVRKGGGLHLIAVEDVEYIKGAGKYSELVLRDGGIELHDKSLERLVQQLAPRFVRIHKSYLVALDRIARLTVARGGRYQAVLHSGVVLPVGRARFAALRDALL